MESTSSNNFKVHKFDSGTVYTAKIDLTKPIRPESATNRKTLQKGVKMFEIDLA